jgi:RNA polymerase sigma-70 factor (ECF subfamily)
MDHPAENGTLDGTPHDSHSPEELLDRRRAAQLLDCVLDEMTDDCRQVLVLFEFEQMSTPEIAQLVGIPLGTAASRLRRARESFKNAVAELESRYKQTGAQP